MRIIIFQGKYLQNIIFSIFKSRAQKTTQSESGCESKSIRFLFLKIELNHIGGETPKKHVMEREVWKVGQRCESVGNFPLTLLCGRRKLFKNWRHERVIFTSLAAGTQRPTNQNTQNTTPPPEKVGHRQKLHTFNWNERKKQPSTSFNYEIRYTDI